VHGADRVPRQFRRADVRLPERGLRDLRAVPGRARYCSRRRARSHDLGVGVRRRVPGVRPRDARCALLLLLAFINADAGAECRTVPRAVESAILKAVVTTVAATNKSADEHAIRTTLSSTLSGADARAPDAVVDAVARPFLDAVIDTHAAAHGKLRADASADHNTLVTALSGALTVTIDELRPDNRRPAVITTDADADADPVAAALDGRADGGVPDGVSIGCGRHEW
jgi:hypothetical protein